MTIPGIFGVLGCSFFVGKATGTKDSELPPQETHPYPAGPLFVGACATSSQSTKHRTIGIRQMAESGRILTKHNAKLRLASFGSGKGLGRARPGVQLRASHAPSEAGACRSHGFGWVNDLM